MDDQDFLLLDNSDQDLLHDHDYSALRKDSKKNKENEQNSSSLTDNDVLMVLEQNGQQSTGQNVRKSSVQNVRKSLSQNGQEFSGQQGQEFLDQNNQESLVQNDQESLTDPDILIDRNPKNLLEDPENLLEDPENLQEDSKNLSKDLGQSNEKTPAASPKLSDYEDEEEALNHENGDKDDSKDVDKLNVEDLMNYKSDVSIRQMIKDAFNQEEFADSTIIVNDVEFKVNSFMVKLHSKKLWSHLMENEEKSYKIEGYEPETIKAMLKFMYAYDLQGGATTELWQLSEEYEIMSLKACCIHVLFSQIDMENILHHLELSFKINSKPLMQTTIRFAVDHIDEILKLPGWNKFAEKHGKIASTILLNIRKQQRTVEMVMLGHQGEEPVYQQQQPNQSRMSVNVSPIVGGGDQQRPFRFVNKRRYPQSNERPTHSRQLPGFSAEMQNSNPSKKPQFPVPTLFGDKLKSQQVDQFEDPEVVPIQKKQRNGQEWQNGGRFQGGRKSWHSQNGGGNWNQENQAWQDENQGSNWQVPGQQYVQNGGGYRQNGSYQSGRNGNYQQRSNGNYRQQRGNYQSGQNWKQRQGLNWNNGAEEWQGQGNWDESQGNWQGEQGNWDESQGNWDESQGDWQEDQGAYQDDQGAYQGNWQDDGSGAYQGGAFFN